MVKDYKLRQITAIQYTGDNLSEVIEFCGKVREFKGKVYHYSREGRELLEVGDFIFYRGGEFLVMSDLSFSEYYEEV